MIFCFSLIGHPYDVAVKTLMGSFMQGADGFISDREPLQIQVKTLGNTPGDALSNFGLGLEVGMSKTMAMFALVEILTLDWDVLNLPNNADPPADLFSVLTTFMYVKVLFKPSDTMEGLVLRSVGAHMIITCCYNPCLLLHGDLCLLNFL